MKKGYLKFVPVLLMVFLLPCACLGGNARPAEITAVGTVQKQGITTYMYGTHVLKDESGKTLYALTSDRVDLDRYVGRKVTVRGDLVGGYPVDGGPPYLRVAAVE